MELRVVPGHVLGLTYEHKEAIKRGWNDVSGSRNEAARAMGDHCFVLHGCGEVDALYLTELVRRRFDLTYSNCWYDCSDRIFSVYCGYQQLITEVMTLVVGYFKDSSLVRVA